MKSLINYLTPTSCLAFVTVNGKPVPDTETYEPISLQEKFEIDSDKSLQLLLRFAKNINSISSYPENHVESLERFLSADSSGLTQYQ